MKRLAMEELCGLILLLMVFLAAKYGSVQVVSAQAQKKEQPVVVVDVGHGGRDPGKVGIDGSLEKDVNLAIALRLKTYLEQSDVKVVTTRETDTALYGKEDSRKKMADMLVNGRGLFIGGGNYMLCSLSEQCCGKQCRGGSCREKRECPHCRRAQD